MVQLTHNFHWLFWEISGERLYRGITVAAGTDTAHWVPDYSHLQNRRMAATRGEVSLFCLTFLAVFAVCGGSSTCYIGNSHYDVCEHGCCGTYPYEECCINLTALIVGLVVAAVVVVCIAVAVVCFVIHQKSNQVVRMAPSAHSRGDTANITILHMSSNNPYDHAPPPQPHMMTTSNIYPNQPALPPPGQPSGFNHPHHHHHPAPGFPPPTAKMPPTGADPAFPPGSHPPPPGGNSGPASCGPMMVGSAPGMMPPSEAPGMMPLSSMNGAAGMPVMNGGSAMMNGGPKMMSSAALPKITPRKVPLPSVPVAAGAFSPEPPGPRLPMVTAFGDSKGKEAERQREATSLGATGHTAGNDMGVEDIEEVY